LEINLVDGNSNLYVQETFEIDSWIPIIESVNDWARSRFHRLKKYFLFILDSSFSFKIKPSRRTW